MPPLTQQSLASLTSAKYLYLTTTGRVSGQPRTVELWFIVHQDRIYLVNSEPERTHWVQNLLRNANVGVRIESYTGQGRARVLDRSEQPLWDAVNRLACEKYNEPEPWGTPVEIAV